MVRNRWDRYGDILQYLVGQYHLAQGTLKQSEIAQALKMLKLAIIELQAEEEVAVSSLNLCSIHHPIAITHDIDGRRIKKNKSQY